MAETYVIGPGIEAAMRQYADEPKGDEVYLPDGTTSVTPGRDRLYFYSKSSNEVYVAPKAETDTPLPVRMLSVVDVSSNNGMDIGPLLDRYTPDVCIIKAYQSIELGATGFRYTVAQTRAAEERGIEVAYYVWLYAGIDGKRQIESAHKSILLAGGDGRPIYPDMETYTDGSSPSREVCLQAKAETLARTPTPGNYTGLWWIDGHYPGGQAQYSADWGDTWGWFSQYDGNTALDSTKLPHGYPADKLGGKQYRGSPVDLSTFRSDALGL